MVRKLLFLFLLGSCATLYLPAQNALQHSANVIQRKQLEWQNITTANFDIHFYTPDKGLASVAARYAEESLFDICRFLDFKNGARFSIYVYTSPFDLIQSNQFPGDKIKEGGITPVKNNSIGVIFDESSIKFHQRIKTAVATLLIEDFYFGGPLQVSIQNSVLLHTPRWFAEGLPAFMGEGWTYEDEMWLSSLENENLLDYALEGDEHIDHIVRKSIWYYIANQYGTEKLTEIFYMTRLTRSVDAGIIHVLGITLKTLTERWWEFTLQRISENHEFRVPYADQSKQVPIAAGDRMLGFAPHPKQPMVAVYLVRKGIHRIELFDLEKEKWKSTGISGGFRTDQLDRFDITMPMAWSPDGNRLIADFFRKSETEMVLYDLNTEEHTFVPYRKGMDRILSFSFSNDGKFLAVSGLRNGSIDIYYTTPGNGRFNPVTQDLYDNLDPVWTLDDERILFASTRDVDTLGGETSYEHYVNHLDIFSAEKGKELNLQRVTRSPRFNERPVQMLSSFELAIQTDQAGVSNLMRKNIFLGDSAFITNITQGFRKAVQSDSLLIFSTPVKGKAGLFYGPKEEMVSDVIVLDSRLRFTENIQFSKEVRRMKLQLELDSIKKVQEAKIRNREPVIEPKEAPKDSAEKEKPEVRYIVFDEDGDELPSRPSRRKVNKKKQSSKRITTIERPDFDTLAIRPGGRTETHWAATKVTSAFRFDPMFKLNMLLEAEITDLSGDKQIILGFRPFSDFKSSDFYAQYGNRKHKVDWYAGFTRSSRYLNRENYLLRYNANRADGQLVLPVNRFLRMGTGAHAATLRRLNLDPFRPDLEQDSTAVTAGLSAFLEFDNRERELEYVKSGNLIRMGIQGVGNVGNGTFNFATARFDVRRYQPVFKNMVLALRGQGAMSIGNIPQKFFLGGADEWLFSRFQNPADFPIAGEITGFHYMEYATPVRGFLFNGRNGSKFMAASAELRLPLSRMGLKQLNSNPIYNVEFVPFFDVGTAWEEGNPLSQRNPIDTETIDSYPLFIKIQTLKSPFIMGVGGGLRMMIFGYSVRADLAWGVEDYTILDPKLHLTLSRDF